MSETEPTMFIKEPQMSIQEPMMSGREPQMSYTRWTRSVLKSSDRACRKIDIRLSGKI